MSTKSAQVSTRELEDSGSGQAPGRSSAWVDVGRYVNEGEFGGVWVVELPLVDCSWCFLGMGR